MKHRIGFNRLRRKASHRKALHRSMVTALFKYERIKTTKAKAKEIKWTAEKMITRATVDNVHNRRIIFKNIKDSYILNKLFTDIAPRFQKRAGGYTRILKLGLRNSDSAELVLLELVERKEIVRRKKKTKEATETSAKES